MINAHTSVIRRIAPNLQFTTEEYNRLKKQADSSAKDTTEAILDALEGFLGGQRIRSFPDIAPKDFVCDSVTTKGVPRHRYFCAVYVRSSEPQSDLKRALYDKPYKVLTDAGIVGIVTFLDTRSYTFVECESEDDYNYTDVENILKKLAHYLPIHETALKKASGKLQKFISLYKIVEEFLDQTEPGLESTDKPREVSRPQPGTKPLFKSILHKSPCQIEV